MPIARVFLKNLKSNSQILLILDENSWKIWQTCCFRGKLNIVARLFFFFEEVPSGTGGSSLSEATLVASKSQFLRKVISLTLVSAALLILSTALASAQNSTFAGNAQHTNLYTAPAQHINHTIWQTPIDDTNSGAFAHYGEPLISAGNTVIVPVLDNPSYPSTPTPNAVHINAFGGADGQFKFTLSTDYAFPSYGWVPEYQPTLVGQRLYYPGAGGTIYYVDNVDSTPTAPTQLCFYGTMANYTANAAAYNSSVYIDTPITPDANGNIFFGFRMQGTPVAPFPNTNPNGPVSGYARISSTGVGTYVLVDAMTSDPVVTRGCHNMAPAISNDGSTVYVVAKKYNTTYYGYICGLDSTTLATKYNRFIQDPRPGGSAAGPIEDGTASPLVAPDGDVYMGMFVTPYNGSRGFLAHYSADLSVVKTPGAFGWDFTPGIVPASMVPSYHGKSSYLLFCKYHNYDTGGGSSDGGDEINTVAILDPEDETQIDWHPQAAGMVEMREVLTMIGPTANAEVVDLNSVREWCVNATAVNPATDSVSFNSEDGRTYRWNLTQNSLSECLVLTTGFGVPYVPAFIGPDGTVYTFNGTYLFANGAVPGITVTLDSDHQDARQTVVGDNVTFTANVTDPAATGASTVTFIDECFDNYTKVDTTLGTVPLVSGQASISTSTLKAGVYNSGADIYLGSHFITAVYNQNGTYSPSNPGITRVQKVHYFASATTANASASNINNGDPVTLNANVVSVPSGSGDPPKAMVAFVDSNGAVVGQAHVDGTGLATTMTTHLSPGTHNITAVFNGDTEFATSSSAPFTVTVAGGLSTFTVTPNTFRAGLTATGTVTLGLNAPSGGQVVTLSNTNTVNAVVPASVTVPAGTNSTTFTISGHNATLSNTTATITATCGSAIPQGITIQPADFASFVSQTVPTAMTAGQNYSVSVLYKNNGTTTWTTAGTIKLLCRNSNPTTWGPSTIPLTTSPCAPGATGTFSGTVTAPTVAGTYNFMWAPEESSINLIFGATSPTVAVTVTKAADAAHYVSRTGPTSVNAGADFWVQNTMTNVGTNTWLSTAGYNMMSVSPNNNTTWFINRLYMPANSSIAPGAQGTFTGHCTAPITPGSYTMQWQCDKAGTPFGDKSPLLTITVVQGPDNAHYVSETAIPTSIGPSKTFTASFTMQNVGTGTWSALGGYSLVSVGSNNFGVSNITSPTVSPTANGTFPAASPATFTAPASVGTYTFQWRMANGSTQFGERTPLITIVVGNDAATYVSSTGATTVNAGADFAVSNTMKNTGITTWTSGGGYSMMTVNPNNDPKWNITRLTLSGSISPGSQGTFSGTCTAPSTPGTYTMQWQCDNSGTPFGQMTPSLSITVTLGADDAKFVSQSVPTTVVHGTTFSATITMQNLGTSTWSSGAGYSIKSQNPAGNTNWGTATVAVSGSVAQNANAVITHTFTAPSTPGTYHFQWRMLHSTATFGEYTPDVTITVT